MKLIPTLLAVCAASLTTFAIAQLKAPRNPVTPATSAAQPTAASTNPPTVPGDIRAEREAAGKLAGAGWLVLLDRRDWGRAWETASASFRKDVPLAAWMDGVPKLRGEMGAFIERTPVESVYKTAQEGGADGEHVSVIFKTRFENKQAEEILTLVPESDGKWRIVGYMTR